MSAPLEDVIANNNAVFESASASPAVANSVPFANNSAPSANNSVPLANNSVPLANNSVPLANNSAPLANNSVASPLSNIISAPENSGANSSQNFTSIVPAPLQSSTTSTQAVTVSPSNVVYQPKRTRSQLQMQHDARAKEFRARVNPSYVGMFSNIPQKLRPKGFPAAAARQAIELSPEEQNAFVKNVADERRNAIEVKLGKKTRRVNPSSLKDIESILKMSEQSLVRKYPSDKALIRMFGRETRRVARNYTSEHINTLATPSRNVTRKSMKLKTPLKNSRNSRLSEIELKNNSNNQSRRNVNPPAYNE